MASKDRSLVRASDIGTWTFCHRAWWLAHVQKVPHQNPDQLARGDQMHSQHGRMVAMTPIVGRLGVLLLGLGILLVLILIIWY
ncbi:MAG: hypothetical protein AAF702_26305 [Chloroflexota bacterium]